MMFDNNKKTYPMITIDRQAIEVFNPFKYLGCLLNDQVNLAIEIRTRIEHVRSLLKWDPCSSVIKILASNSNIYMGWLNVTYIRFYYTNADVNVKKYNYEKLAGMLKM